MKFALEIMSFALLVTESRSAIFINEKPNHGYELMKCYTTLERHERIAERYECRIMLKKKGTQADIELYDHMLQEHKMAVIDCNVTQYNGQGANEFKEMLFPHNGCLLIIGEISSGHSAMWIYLLVGVGFISIIGVFTFIEVKYLIVRNYWRRKAHIPIDGSIGGRGVAYIELSNLV